MSHRNHPLLLIFWMHFLYSEGVLVIRCHLARLIDENKLKIADVGRKIGLNRNTVTLLYEETAQRIDLDRVEKLCELFECEVGDLLKKVDG